MSNPNDEAVIRAQIAEWSRALEAKDVDGLLREYTDESVLFDASPPCFHKGRDAIRRVWEHFLPYFPKNPRSEHRDLRLTVSGDLAFLHALHRISSADTTAESGCLSWMRVTVCYQKLGGEWKVVHEHVSLPFDPSTGKVCMLKDEDVRPGLT
jgi:uncharacterized protein (TIGR02246 family)